MTLFFRKKLIRNREHDIVFQKNTLNFSNITMNVSLFFCIFTTAIGNTDHAHNFMSH